MQKLITLCFFIAAPWMTSQTIDGNSGPLLGFLAVLSLLVFLFVIRDRCWMIIPFTLPIEGNLNFLPLNFSIQELSIIGVALYLVYRMIFGLDVSWRVGPASIWVPLALLLSIIVYHWVDSRDIGIKLLGGTGWGGRKYFTVLMASFGMLLLNSFPGISWADLQKVPLLYFLGAFVDIVPGTISTLVPATAPYIWRVYSGVNLTEYGSFLRGNFAGEGLVTRIGQLALVGKAVGLVTLCYIPPKTWLALNRLWALPTVLLGGVLCAASGFRGTVVGYSVAFLAGLVIALTQGTVFNYPLALQRGLSFLPGQWETKASLEAADSSKWREKMKTLFYKEYFQRAPFIGQGYHYDPNLAKNATDIYLAIVQRQADAGDEFADVRSFIEMRQPHEGVLHALLISGALGTFFFSAFCFGFIFYAWRSTVHTPPNDITPIQTWCFALLLAQLVGFFLLFGDYTNFLIQVCPITSLIYRAETLRRAALKARPPLVPNFTPYPSAALSPQA
ncbi:MAG: hypothetical protein EBS69_07885 [Verrucomicrobia bacterium]|nr:hypothetical protein [Verrucomicrobiota bacterium]